ncbi:MAG: hypothetical protein V1835_07000 [Candidatus Micrarchaeota archaeon]
MKKILAFLGRDPIDAFLTILAILVFAAAAIMLILKLTGHSPTEDQLLITVLAGMGINMFRIEHTLGEFGEFKRTTNENFKQINYQLRILSQKFDRMDRRLTRLESQIANA